MILIGFMGSGKTTIGKKLAKQLNKPFIDLDQFIVDEAKMTIPEIFNKFGEEGFREKEFKALESVIDKDAIISTGGGVVTNQKSYDLLKTAKAQIFYLEVPFDISYNRIKNDKNRPLTNGGKSGLEDIYNSRISLYDRVSDYSINGCDNVNEIIHNILMHKK